MREGVLRRIDLAQGPVRGWYDPTVHMWGPCVWVSNDSKPSSHAQCLASCRPMLRTLHSYPPPLRTASRFTAISMSLSRNGVFQVCHYRNPSKTRTGLGRDGTGLSRTSIIIEREIRRGTRTARVRWSQHSPTATFPRVQMEMTTLRENSGSKLYWARSAGGGRGK